jgi:Flp pilus assembly protein TadG
MRQFLAFVGPRGSRRGSQAVEFALTLPLLSMLLLGLVDYGWYFLRQSMVVNAVREAMRLGALQTPESTDVDGDCTKCKSMAASQIASSLADVGITVSASEVTPAIENVSGTCALTLSPVIVFEPLAGFVATPDLYDVNAIAFLPNVTGC